MASLSIHNITKCTYLYDKKCLYLLQTSYGFRLLLYWVVSSLLSIAIVYSALLFTVLETLFAEELGFVLEVAHSKSAAVMAAFEAVGVQCTNIGSSLAEKMVFPISCALDCCDFDY